MRRNILLLSGLGKYFLGMLQVCPCQDICLHKTKCVAFVLVISHPKVILSNPIHTEVILTNLLLGERPQIKLILPKAIFPQCILL